MYKKPEVKINQPFTKINQEHHDILREKKMKKLEQAYDEFIY